MNRLSPLFIVLLLCVMSSSAHANTGDRLSELLPPLRKQRAPKSESLLLFPSDLIVSNRLTLSDFYTSDDFLRSVTSPRPDYSRIKFTGLHSYWFREVTRLTRSLLSEDRDRYIENSMTPGVAGNKYDDMLSLSAGGNMRSSVSYQSNLSLTRGVVIGRARPYFKYGPFTLTNKLRFRIDLDHIRVWLFGAKAEPVPENRGEIISAKNYKNRSVNPGPNRLAKRPTFNKIRIRASASVNTDGVNNIRASVSADVNVVDKGTAIPIVISGEYDVEDNEMIAQVQISILNF